MSALVDEASPPEGGERTSEAPSSHVRAGNDARPELSLEAVYDEYFAFVWRTLGYLGVSPSNREDAAQEVFLVVHRKLPAFERRAEVRTWLFSIARNVARNVRRSERRRGAEELPEELVSLAPTPDDNLSTQRALRFLQAFLDELDEGKRDVFILSELEGLTAIEVGATLDLSPNTVYSRLRLVREAFAKKCAQLGGNLR